VKNGPGRFEVSQLQKQLAELPATRRFWVGFSGGADSTALMVAMHDLAPDMAAEIHAVHFNHKLQPAADDWQKFCQEFCRQRDIPLHLRTLDLDYQAGSSHEELARDLRYAAVESLLDNDDIYLTAHHADDNAETLFLNLMRGSGIYGLAGVPPLRRLGKAWVARPLLTYQRSDLQAFLQNRGIHWMEDPSNLDINFNRNYLRNMLFPDMEQHWPGVVQRLIETANHARTLTDVVSGLLAEHYEELIGDNYTMPVTALRQLDVELQALLIRQWLRDQDLINPPRARLREFLAQINSSANKGSHAELRWARRQIKKHGELLWQHQYPYPSQCPSQAWSESMECDLGPDFGKMTLSGELKTLPEGWSIGPRRHGAAMALQKGGPHKKLKELMRLGDIPTWLRDALPVLYWKDETAAVGDCLLSARLKSFLSDNSISYNWQPKHPLLCKLQSVSVHNIGKKE